MSPAPPNISYNTPFPTVNGTPGGGSSQMMGVVMNTEDNGYEAGTVATFNNPASSASALFISQTGVIDQYGPVGRNWMAWAQAAREPRLVLH